MKIIVTKWLMPGVRAMALWPFILITRERDKNNKELINHESIHLAQQLEMLIITFYLWYLIEYLIKLIIYRNGYKAYKNISFEREAYNKEYNLEYLDHRKHYSWIKYL